MDENQDDSYATRRADLDAQFQALPPVGSPGYWQRIEEHNVANRLPLEVLARCVRDRIANKAVSDVNRIFSVIVRRTQERVSWRARSVATKAKSGMKQQLQEDIGQEFYRRLWQELVEDGPTFLVEAFSHTMDYIFDHAAQSEMTKAGERTRRDVSKSNRIPAGMQESIDGEPENEGELPRAAQLSDPHAQEAFDLAEFRDLLDEVDKLPPADRVIIHGLFFAGQTQEEVAAQLNVTSRTIRNRLKGILLKLHRRYEGGEEDDHV